MSKQTLVEWLKFRDRMTPGFLTDDDYKEAQEMEKKRLMGAFNEGQEYEYQYHVNSTPKFDAENWYNETYGGNKV